jgi:hypothetical protein
MAEAAAVPLAIATVQWSLAAIQKVHSSHDPKRRLNKWKGRVNKALEGIDEHHSRIQPSDMKILMEAHAMQA